MVSEIPGIPRLYAAASLKPRELRHTGIVLIGIPRLYAAASLKPEHVAADLLDVPAYSAALCRGLIEAPEGHERRLPEIDVFRGSMPRPH